MKNERVHELTNGEFVEFTKNGTVLIDFFAEWCMPCVMMEPIIEDLSDKFKGKIKFGRVNVEDNHELSNKFNIRSIPNFVLFKDGKVLHQFIGSMPEEDFEERLRKFI